MSWLATRNGGRARSYIRRTLLKILGAKLPNQFSVCGDVAWSRCLLTCVLDIKTIRVQIKRNLSFRVLLRSVLTQKSPRMIQHKTPAIVYSASVSRVKMLTTFFPFVLKSCPCIGCQLQLKAWP